MATRTETPPRDIGAWRAPWALAAAGALAVLVLVRYGAGARGIIGAAFAVVLVVLSAIDLDQRIIPNRIVLPATAAVLAAQIACFPAKTGEWVGASLGAAAFLALPLVVVRGGVGMGDIKLALLLGAGLGAAVIDALLYGACAGALYAFVLLRRHGDDARSMGFAYGPALAFGGLVALLTGHHVG